MFVLGDLARIRALFDERLWTDLTLEKWRYEHEPLATYPTPEKEIATWPRYLSPECGRAPPREPAAQRLASCHDGEEKT